MCQKDLLQKIYFKIILIIISLLAMAACGGDKLQNSDLIKLNQKAENIVAQKKHHKTNNNFNNLTQSNFKKTLVHTSSFVFTTFQKVETDIDIDTHVKSKKIPPFVTIYIEGDGHTWIKRNQLSNNPTPHNPLALKLAVLDPNPNVVYLARPCQYTDIALNPACTKEIWSNARFSEMVIANMNEAIEKIKKEAKANQIHLVGFSGGAAVAVLIAARRNDIASLKTIAGDLNHALMSVYHNTTPLQNSLNPINFTSKILDIPQIHFAGEKDTVVPTFISETFIKALEAEANQKNQAKQKNPANQKNKSINAKQVIIKNATHHKGWESFWREYLK